MRNLGHVTRFALGLSILSAGVLSASTARANGFETPSNGTEQMARGAAWLARASDPLATFYNPAALSRNGTDVSVSVNLFFAKNCFQRLGPGGQPVEIGVDAKKQSDGMGGTVLPAGATYGEVCNEQAPFPNPQLAFSWRVTDKLGLGIAVMGPSANGKLSYPITQTNTSQGYGNSMQLGAPGMFSTNTGPYPSGSRFLLSELDAKIIWPQIAFGYEIAPRLRVGASFIWGIALLKLGNVSMGQNNTGTLGAAQQYNPDTGRLQENGNLELSAAVTGHDYFVPGLVASALYEATDNIDVAAWYHVSKDVHATGQADVTGTIFNGKDPSKPNDNPTTNHTPDGQTTINVAQPMEARIGVRFHMPRTTAVAHDPDPADGSAPSPAAPAERRIIDPLHDDVFDIELDGEWSHDSQLKNVELRFPTGVPIVVDKGASPPAGSVPLSTVPTNADVPHNWKDSFGVRLGGDYVAIQDRLAIRAGGWFQSSSMDAKYLHIDFLPTQRIALTAGGTVRIGPVDVQLGFAHVFSATLDNGGNGGIFALSGQSGSTNAVSSAKPGFCPPSSNNRSECAINGGRLTSSINIASLGVVYRFR